MAQLAQHFDGHTITRLEEIAQREAVSANFLVQILNDLRKSGLITSKRGKMGGYMLADKPENISLFSVVEAIEPALIDKNISTDGESGELVSQVWKDTSSRFNERLLKITLDEFVKNEESNMFYI